MVNSAQFSVSMCVYGKDNPKHFDIAVQSILDQTIPPTEVILVVDGPVPDELDLVICKYEVNPLFRTIRLEENQGHGNARRIGLQNCNYDLVALMDADDISVSYRFEKQLKIFDNNSSVSLVGGMITEFIDDPANIVAMRTVPSKDSEIKAYMKKRCPLNQVTVMFKKAVVEQAGGYIDWHNEEDYYLWIRLVLINAEFFNIDDVLVNVRIGPEMYERRGGIKYFKSEYRLQRFMYEKSIISLSQFFINVSQRLIVQVLLPNTIRGWVFQKFAREKIR
jgi:glycosyltransferase involved in cell wall biosynthesis